MDDLSPADIEDLIDLIDLADCERDARPWKYLFWFIWMWF